MSTAAHYATSLSDEHGMFCTCCYLNPSGSPVDPDDLPSTFGAFSMAFSMSIKPVVSGA
jgi:hypothetical protein